MKQQVDWPSFISALAIILLVSVPLLVFPESGGDFLIKLYGLLTTQLGFLYLLAGLAVLVFLGWLALGPYGKVRLASGNESPEFSDLSWMAMLFCAIPAVE